jgi:hypothetical protein
LLALLINDVRAEVKKEGMKIDGDGWQKALDLDLLLELLRRGDEAEAKATLLSNLKKQK